MRQAGYRRGVPGRSGLSSGMRATCAAILLCSTDNAFYQYCVSTGVCPEAPSFTISGTKSFTLFRTAGRQDPAYADRVCQIARKKPCQIPALQAPRPSGGRVLQDSLDAR